ncbi:MAG: caspase family protein [Armatimonadota bacterium]
MRFFTTGILGLALIASAMGQSWTSAYEAGLKAAKAGDWASARKEFQKARANRPDDVSGPTNLPGPVTDARKWRGGAPYSPNFLSAYASYKLGMSAKGDAASIHLKTAQDELEGLLKKKQVSKESLYFLAALYSRANQTEKLQGLGKQAEKANWKVDAEVMAPEEVSAMSQSMMPTGNSQGVVAVVDASNMTGVVPKQPLKVGPVAVNPKKYALIIANGDNKLPGFQISHATNDANLLKDSITANAGYDAANVMVVSNASAEQIKTASAALAAKMPAESTLMFFFTGAGANIDNRDWLAGADTQLATDTSSMVAKTEVYRPFVEKGIAVFAFYQVARSAIGGRFFGSEEPKAGRISQMQSTTPGETIYSIFKDGNNVGIFASAMSEVFAELHSNAIPITEFGWQVFYKIRRGQTGSSGGGSRQTPTLPVLQLLASDSRF